MQPGCTFRVSGGEPGQVTKIHPVSLPSSVGVGVLLDCHQKKPYCLLDCCWLHSRLVLDSSDNGVFHTHLTDASTMQETTRLRRTWRWRFRSWEL
jgi:hypothetical protein